MTTGNIKFSQLPNLPAANITAATIAPVVENNVNYKVTLANLTSYINNGGNITTTTVSASGNITGAYFIGNGSQLTGIVSSYGDANVSALLDSGNVTTNVATTGNVSGSYILGNGSQLTGLPATYGNANVTALLASGNITTNVITTGNVSGSYILGNGSQLTGVTATLPSTFTVSGNIVGGNLSTGGNVTGAYILGNGSQLTGLPSGYSNAQVAAYLSSGNVTSNIITTGNITGAYIVGNGSGLSNIAGANVTGTVANATYAATAGTAATANSAVTATTATSATTATTATTAGSATTATTAGTVTTAAQPNITSVGTLTSLSVSGNVQGGNLRTDGQVSAIGNVIGAYILGNGSQMTGTVTKLTAGSGISISGSTGNITITNTGSSSNVVYIANASFDAGSYNTSNTEQISKSLLITGNTYAANSAMGVRHTWDSATTGNAILSMYINSANSLANATPLWRGYVTSNLSLMSNYFRFNSEFDVLYSGNVSSIWGLNIPANANINSSSSQQNNAIINGFGYMPFAGGPNGGYPDMTQNQYLIFSVQQMGNATANVARCVNATVYKK